MDMYSVLIEGSAAAVAIAVAIADHSSPIIRTIEQPVYSTVCDTLLHILLCVVGDIGTLDLRHFD